MNFKEFTCLDKNYLSKKERKSYTIIYSLILISTLLISVVVKINMLITVGIVFVEGISATMILYAICKIRTRKYGDVCKNE